MKRRKRHHKGSEAQSRPAMAHIGMLPMEMLCHVLSYLKLEEQLKLAIVSRLWKQAVEDLLRRRRHFSVKDLPGKGRLTSQTLERILLRLSGLHSLHVWGDNLDVDIISEHCPHLVNVNLRNFRVDESSLERLCRSCPKLETITLPELPKSRADSCVETVLRGLPGLRSLDLDVTNVTGRCLSLLPASLQRLRLSGSWTLDPAELRRAAPCPALTELDVSDFDEVKSGELVIFLAGCRRLERLIAKDSQITDVFLRQLPKKVPGIRHLNLSGCSEFTETGLKHLGKLKELRWLNLFNTMLTDDVLDRLHGAAQLTRLTVGNEPFGGEDFSEEGLLRMVLACPSIKTLELATYSFDVSNFIDSLSQQLASDRDVTLLVDETVLGDIEELPAGPLQLAPIPWEEDE